MVSTGPYPSTSINTVKEGELSFSSNCTPLFLYPLLHVVQSGGTLRNHYMDTIQIELQEHYLSITYGTVG